MADHHVSVDEQIRGRWVANCQSCGWSSPSKALRNEASRLARLHIDPQHGRKMSQAMIRARDHQYGRDSTA